MDAILESLAKLLLVFKEPATVALLMVAAAEGFALYRLGRFILDRYDKDIESRSNLATALNTLATAVKDDK